MYDILTKLRVATQPLHHSLEAVSYGQEIMSKKISLPAYNQLILKNFHIFKQLEDHINHQISLEEHAALNMFRSQRLNDLKKDMAYLPQKEKNIVADFQINFEEMTTARLFGILYVMEGARLGGKVIVKALKNNSGLSAIPNFHFYEQNGVNIRERWLEFMKVLNEHLGKDEAADQEAIQAAKNTFEYFIEVFQ